MSGGRPSSGGVRGSAPIESDGGGGSRGVIYAALASNAAIAIAKYVASAITLSSAMLSEAVHSTVDVGNEALLLFGEHRSRQPADRTHPFGHGMQIYFYGFVVAVLIFGVGAGVSVLDGIEKIAAPEPIRHAGLSYAVLGLAMAFEGWSWVKAFRALGERSADVGIWTAVRASKDPAVFVVLLEDSAALLGLAIALAGTTLSVAFGLHVADGIASVAIGVVLAAAGTVLMVECQSLLTGESADPAITDAIEALLTGEPRVVAVNEVLTMHFAPREILVALSLDLDDRLAAPAVEAAVSAIERRIKAEIPGIGRVFVEIVSRDAPRI